MENKKYVFTEELYAKAKECKSADEIIALAEENGIELSEQQAKEYLAKLNPVNGEIADDELDNIAGGGCDFFDMGACDCGCEKVKVKYLVDEKGYLREAWVCANCEKFWRWK